MKMNELNKFKETYLNILLEENELQRYDNDYFITWNDDILNEEILENHSKILLILF